MSSVNFAFLAYGLVAAWGILFGYVALLARRDRLLRKQIEDLKRMLEQARER